MERRLGNKDKSIIDKFIEKSYDLLTEYEEFLRIDKNDLDNELIAQPDLSYRVGKNLSEVIAYRDTAKLERDKLSAELDRDIRIQASKIHEKLSEAQVANRIKEDPRYDKSQRDYLKYSEWVRNWEALQASYEQRSYAMSKLCDLYISGYYTNSSASSVRSDILTNRAEDIKNRINEQRQDIRTIRHRGEV